MLTNLNENIIKNQKENCIKSTYNACQQTDTKKLLSALDEGWQILEAASYLAHGINAEGRGYLLTLYHPKRALTHEWSVSQSKSMNDILAIQAVPGYLN